MTEAVQMTTKEAAEQLQVHARTIRKWIDTFEEYIQPDINERGHYILSEESFRRLANIKRRLQEPHSSMKQVRENLIKEGKIRNAPWTPSREFIEETEKNLQEMINMMDGMTDLLEEMATRVDHVEKHIMGLFNTMDELQHKLLSVRYESASSNEVHQMFDEIRKKQDQLRMELRNVTFTQRLTAATNEQSLLPRRQKKARFFGLL
ncbi:MerR family transcriptional regulator [Thermoactinomyces mirandus]|uniref:MerR family transcriptional regulator n=1 Tax=Thermoactinomyces mirandus TaxID=2756294 RepID=A0A7W1XT67_9BACL|nr:MerR family transcriptional regulator [Thermoactinomyces mirandus]MBA4602769.1 MerR family transcriptional regulator [Thermoactinomyces mirandus]